MTIQVEPITLWGASRYKPMCSEAKLITLLTRNETLTYEDIVIIKKLGWTVVTKPQETL